MEQHPHLAVKAIALATAIAVGSVHLVAYWGTIAMVIDLLWLPPVVAMAGLLVWDLARAAHKPQAVKAQHS